MDKKELIEYTEEMFRRAGENADSKAGEAASEFVEKLSAYPGILEEYIYFLEHGSYLGKFCVSHATVIDVMVWQMDHFKAMLDRDRTAYKKNPYKMVLEAFRTMAEYANRPEDLAALMGYETGTDYPGKY